MHWENKTLCDLIYCCINFIVNSELNLEFGQQLSAGAMADDGDNEGRVNIY